MTIQDKLRQNTIDIANARINLAGAMRHRLSMRHVQAEDEAALSIAVRRPAPNTYHGEGAGHQSP